ncbi:hypothetical protein [Arthrobacter sp.]|uniref:hypothetical protein n=1 Tax=Arthrobacter sp. TaxID=1667 RepID=UPI003A8FB3F1
MREAPARQGLVSAKAMHVGEDILLARHGDRITELRQNRKHDITIARLQGGATDWAANRLVDMTPRITDSPAARFGRLSDDFRSDKLGIKRDEARFLAKVGAVWGGVVVALSGGILWMAYHSGNTEMMQALMTNPGY